MYSKVIPALVVTLASQFYSPSLQAGSLPSPPNPLSPQTNVEITTTSLATSPVDIAASPAGFLVTWTDTNADIQSSFSTDHGQTWSSPVVVGGASSYNPTITAKGSQFLVAWVVNAPGFNTGYAAASYSDDNGATWSFGFQISPLRLSILGPGSNVSPPVQVCANADGYMAVWSSYDYGMTNQNNVWTAFSTDGENWTNAVMVNPGSSPVDYTATTVAANAAGFLVSWQDDNTHAGYVSFSSNHGATWGTPVQVATDLYSQVNLSLTTNGSTFIAAWVDSSQVAYSSFSTNNGSTWSTPTQIGESIASYTAVSVVGTGSSCIASWVDTNYNVYTSFSSNNGSVWSESLGITSDNSVLGSYQNGPKIAATPSGCLFAWLDSYYNPATSYAALSGNAPKKPKPTCFNQITPSSPGRPLL